VTRTDKLDIAAAGLIDLKTERIDIQFKAAPRSGIGLSAAGLVHPYVKVGGSLAQPGLVFDSTGALISGGAAVATSGLSIVAKSLFDRVSGAVTDPCAQLIATADQGAPTAVVGNPLDAVKKGSGKIGTPAAAPPPGPAK